MVKKISSDLPLSPSQQVTGVVAAVDDEQTQH
jgi:hypothetical protein